SYLRFRDETHFSPSAVTTNRGLLYSRILDYFGAMRAMPDEQVAGPGAPHFPRLFHVAMALDNCSLLG
ncbi:MAG: hypothetical protein QG657_5733, partial [Acidobacteriota bacterium]|nr:hypothetical protein [Acidobacteriota bacterium]